MGASSQYRPDTRAPGGGGMDYNGNPVGGGMGAQTNIGGPQMIGGAYGRPIYGQPPQQGDLYRPGGNRFMPGRGMVPPAGRVGNPRQVNPGGGGMRPGMPPGQIGQPGGQPPIQMPMPGRGKGGGGGKGGFPGPGVIGSPGGQPIIGIDPGFDGIGGDGGGGEPGVNPYGRIY